MGIPKTVRLKDEIEEKVKVYLERNSLSFPDLINMAVEKFISEPHTIELVPVGDDELMKHATKAFKKHKHAMDKLK
jgi:hypothetical protein